MLRPSIFHDSFSNRFFDNFFDDMYVPSTWGNQVNVMSTDIREEDGGYVIEMELPGFAKEDIKAELKSGYMTIYAKHQEEKEEKTKKKYIRKERYCGCYERSFYVGDAITEEDINAKFNDGVLTVFVPKKEKQPEVEQKKYIAIESN